MEENTDHVLIFFYFLFRIAFWHHFCSTSLKMALVSALHSSFRVYCLFSTSTAYFNKHFPTCMTSFHLLQTSLVRQLTFHHVPSVGFRRNTALKLMSHRGIKIPPLFQGNVCHVLFTCGNFSLHLKLFRAFFQLLLKA